MKIKDSKRKIILRILKKIVIILMLLMILYNLVYIISKALKKEHKIFGFNYIVYEEEILKPEVNRYDLVLLKDVENNNIYIGDIIVIKNNDNNVLKKIEFVDENSKQVFTKAKSNYYYNSSELYINDIKEKMWIRIPYIGFVIKILQSNFITCIFIITIIIYGIYYRNNRKKRYERRKKKLMTFE